MDGNHQFNVPPLVTAGAAQTSATLRPEGVVYSITATQSTGSGTGEQNGQLQSSGELTGYCGPEHQNSRFSSMNSNSDTAHEQLVSALKS